MGEIAYTSKVRIERRTGPLRYAWLPAESQPIRFGVHSAIARHYGLKPGQTEEHAATLDYVVAAAGG